MADSSHFQADNPVAPKRPRLVPRLARWPRIAAEGAAPWPAAVDALRERAGRRGTDLAAGAGAALVVAAGGWFVAVVLTFAVWATAPPAGQSPSLPLRAAGQLWLAAHHVLLRTPDGPFGLTPLGFTVLPAGALVLAGRYAGVRFGSGIWSVGAVALCYPLAAWLVAFSASSGAFYSTPGATTGYPCLIASCCFAAGLLAARSPGLEPWAAAALRAAAAAAGVLAAGGAALAALAVLLRFGDVARVGDMIGRGAAGDGGLFLIDLALVPNLIVWAVGFLSGPGFLVGDGMTVAIGGVSHGPLPGLPLLQAVPAVGTPSAWTYAVFAVPLAAGLVTLLIIGSSVRSFADRTAALGAALGTVGAAVGAAALLSGGPVAAGPMSALGPVAWRVVLAVMLEIGLVAGAGFALWYAGEYVRAYARRPRTALAGSGAAVADDRSGLDGDRGADLVGQGLLLGVPERPPVPEAAGSAAEAVEQVVPDRETETDRLAGGLAHQPDADHLLADALPGGALAVEVVAPDAQGHQQAEVVQAQVGPAADLERVGIDGGRRTGGVGEDQADDRSGGRDQRVEQDGSGPGAP